MKIAFDARELTQSQPSAGIGQYIQGVYGAIIQENADFQLTAFCHEGDSPLRSTAGIESIDLSEKYFGKWTQTGWEYFFWGRCIDRLKADVFHSTAHLYPGLLKTPGVLTLHDMTNFLFPGWYRLTNQLNRLWHLRRGIHHARRIIAVSESTRRDLCRLFPQAEKKVEVVYEGAEEMFHPRPDVQREAIGLSFQEPFILWVGTSSPRKNLRGLLKAFEIICRRNNEVRLVLVGQRGWKDSPDFEFIRGHGLARRVYPMGYQPREKLPLFYSACSLFVFPSLYEGFGLPLLEAMACGAVVLAANTSSLPEILTDSSLLFDPVNAEEMADKILQVLEHPARQREIAQASLARARQFSWQRAARETLDVFRRALE